MNNQNIKEIKSKKGYKIIKQRVVLDTGIK